MDNEAKVNKTKSKRRKIVEGVLYGIFGLFVTASLTISILTIYHNNKYTKFFVDGQSMYPTLNLNAKYPDGRLIGQRRAGSAVGTYDVDYGFMDKSDAAINSIKRFDIVVCRFANDSTDLIKRVLVLPGETFFFTTGVKDSPDNGNLYIKGVGQSEFTLVEQPINPEIVHGGYYLEKPQYSNTVTGYTMCISTFCNFSIFTLSTYSTCKS